MSAHRGSQRPEARSRAYRGGAVVFAIAAVATAGCSMPAPETTGAADPGAAEKSSVAREAPASPALTKPDATYVELLMRKAKELAERELGRMSAAELTYRNTVSFQELVGTMFTPGTGNYMKMYRSFNDFSIRDIYRSESFVFPVAVEIQFEYQFLNTQPRPSTLPDAEALSKSDTRFSIAGTYTLTRRYRCDGEGNYTGRLPELPPRPDYYRRGLDQAAEPNAAQPNRLPAGGPGAGTALPMASPLDSLPRPPGGSFP